MNDLIEIVNGQAVTNSRQIAEHFGKNHRDVLRIINDIKGRFSTAQFCALFSESFYKASNGKTNPEYLMNRDGFSFLVMGFTGEKADIWKLKYIQAFNNMELELLQNKFQLPDFNDPVASARAWADVKESEQKLALELEQAKPKLEYLDQILNSKGLLNTTQIAKAYGLSAIALNKILHQEKIQYKSNGTWVLCSKYQNSGWMVQKMIKTGDDRFIPQSYWTQRGRLKINDVLVAKGYVAIGETTLFDTRTIWEQ